MLDACLELANRLRRPPTRKELREAVNWRGATKEFTTLLREAGLAWLREDHAARKRRARQMRTA